MKPLRAGGVVLLAAAGCAQILGLHERSEEGDGGPGANNSLFDGRSTANTVVVGQCGQLPHPSASCASCMDQSCCAEARACAGEAACAEASGCLAACSDAACRARCGVFYTSPETLLALRACRVKQCASACGSACGELAPSGVTSCQACEESTCCGQGATCAANINCASLNLCVSNCFGAASCPNDCQAKYPLGTTDFAAWFGCSNQCTSKCQPGQSWACLDGPIVWPKPPAAVGLTFSVTFVNFTGEQPFVGATVKACSNQDVSCTAPLHSATTDASGQVTLTVPPGLSGFDGYLDISGGMVNGSGAAAFPAIWYPVPFVVADGWRGRTQLVSTDEFLALTAATGTSLDPSRAHIAVNAVDCAFTPASGVSLVIDSADQKTVSFYLQNGLPVTGATATDPTGVGAFINLPTTPPARLAVVRAFAGGASGKSMGSLTFILRPGTLTTSSVFPPVP